MGKIPEHYKQALFLLWPLGFSIGIVAANYLAIAAFSVCFAIGLLLFFALFRHSNHGLRLALSVIFFALGGLVWHLQYKPVQFASYMGISSDNYAQIVDIQPLENGRRYILKRNSDNVEYIRVTTKYHQPTLQICDMVNARSFLIPPNTGYVPGGFNLKQYSNLKHIVAYGSLREPLELVHKGKYNARCLINKYRFKLYERLSHYFSDSNVAIASALLLGYRSEISKETNLLFKHFGISHMLAISGLHMALVAGFAFGAFRALLCLSGYLSLHYNVKKIAAWMSIPIIILYCLAAGMQASTIRAAIMTSTAMMAIILDRPILSFRTFSYALFLILFFMPEQLYSTSFQLSFLAVLGLILLVKSSNLSTKLRQYMGVSLFLMIWLLPVNFYYFGYISLWSFFANGLLIPFLTIVIMPLLLLGFIIPPLWYMGDWILWLLQYILEQTERFVIILPHVKPDIWVMILYYALFTIILIFIQSWKKLTFSISLLLITFFMHLHFVHEDIKRDWLIYKDGQVFWLENKQLHTNIPKGRGVSEYIQQQVRQYYGIHPQDTIITSKLQNVHILQHNIQKVTNAEDIPNACMHATLVLTSSNINFTCPKQSNALILSAPNGQNFYHIRLGRNDNIITQLRYIRP